MENVRTCPHHLLNEIVGYHVVETTDGLSSLRSFHEARHYAAAINARRDIFVRGGTARVDNVYSCNHSSADF
jgi:hypothetical protein